MERTDSIFYGMTREDENSATELLCNLFRIKYFRDVCLEYFGIEKKYLDEITLEHIFSQYTIADGGRPDMIIETENLFYIIENKIRPYTGLQENQQGNYPEFLLKQDARKKDIGYIFLIPRNYEHESEINAVIEKHQFARRYYWDDFLAYLYGKKLHDESPIIKEGLNYFKNIVSIVVDTTLTSREVVMMYNPKTIREVLELTDKVRGIVHVALELVIKEMGSDCSLSSDKNSQWEQGSYLNYKNKKNSIFVGLSPALHEVEIGIFVFSAALCERHLKRDVVIDDTQFKRHSYGGWLCIPIERSLFVEDNKEKLLSAEIIKILKNVHLKNCSA
jgi:hypothetical protein